MKVIIMITVILVIIFAGSAMASSYLNDTSSSFGQELNILEHNIRDGKWYDAQAQITSLEDKWKGIKDGWAMLLDHQEIDNIELTLSRLKEYVKNSNTSDSLAEVSALKMLFEHIPEKEAVSLKNIL